MKLQNKKMTDRWIVNVEKNEEGEHYIQLTEEMLANSGFQIGDNLDWKNNGDGSWSLIKKTDTERDNEKSP
jgi:hypothetical protein